MLKKGLKFIIAALVVTSIAGMTAGCSPKQADTTSTKTTTPQKFVFWDKSEYNKAYNDAQREKVKEFKEKYNIDIEYVVIPASDMKQKLTAAVEAKNPPDLVVTDDFLAGQFAGMGQLIETDDIINQIGLADYAKRLAKAQGKNYMIPQAILAPGFYLRKDKWDAKGLKYPTTWQELKEQAKIINDPANNFYALGFPMGASGGGDAEGFCRSVILSFGGQIADKDHNVKVNSPQTLEALKFIASLYQEKLVPPSAITWDDSGNNTAYAAGTVGAVFNSGSIMNDITANKPDIAKNTIILPYPKGANGSYSLGGGNVYSIFKNGKGTEAAKKFVLDFFQKDNYTKLIEKMGGMWQPTITGVDNTDFWKKPENAGWLANSKVIVANTYPEENTDINSKAFSSQLCVKAVQRIVVNKMDPQKSLDQLEKDLKAIYVK